MSRSTDTQAFLKQAKTKLRMTTSELALAFGFNERTLKSWLLPVSSVGYRPMPTEALDLVKRSLLPKGAPFWFPGFVAGVPADPKHAVMSRDDLVEFPRLYLLKMRNQELVREGVEFVLVKQDGQYFKVPIEIDQYCISFTGSPGISFDADRYEVVESKPFTFMTRALAEALGPRYLYIIEVESAEMASGFREALYQTSIWAADINLADSFISCAFKGRYFIAYLATPQTWAKIKNYTYFSTLQHWNLDSADLDHQWIKCFDPHGAEIDNCFEDDAPPEPNWIPVADADIGVLIKTSGGKLLNATGEVIDDDTSDQ